MDGQPGRPKGSCVFTWYVINLGVWYNNAIQTIQYSKLLLMAEPQLGGGFVYPAAAQFGWCWDLLSSRKLGPDVAVAFLSMGLAPESAYPKQLSQMVEMVRYLTNDAGKLPENVSS